MQNVYKNIEENNPGQNFNLLMVFDDIIADITSKKT